MAALAELTGIRLVDIGGLVALLCVSDVVETMQTGLTA